MTMNRNSSALLAAAVSGLLLGGITGCSSEKQAPDSTQTQPAGGGASPAALAIADKHVCKGQNSCEGKGGCKTADHSCAGKNSCQGKGGCATVAHHSCKGQNSCKGQGGCKTADHSCAGKNSCEGKGGCAVPLKH